MGDDVVVVSEDAVGEPVLAHELPDVLDRVGVRYVLEGSVRKAMNKVRVWDGRANIFFNGVNPFGMLDPQARVRRFNGTTVVDERINIPFSSTASQAVGPIGSPFEMSMNGRPAADLGKKLTATGVRPLAGQTVDCTDDDLVFQDSCSSSQSRTSVLRQPISPPFRPIVARPGRSLCA